jgi:hypothetical protein
VSQPRSCLIDGEAIGGDEAGPPVFELILFGVTTTPPCSAPSTCNELNGAGRRSRIAHDLRFLRQPTMAVVVVGE